MFRWILILIWLVVAATSSAYGVEYYRLPVDERLYADTHDLFAPNGLIGQGYGIVGTIMIVTGVALYTARKRFVFLSHFGRLKGWLEFHIFLCTLGPFLVLLHTTFRFGGVVAIAFWSMAAVVVSGVFGRYVYVWIPKTVNGSFLTQKAIDDEKVELIARARSIAPIDEAALEKIWGQNGHTARPGLASALSRSVRYRLSRRREHKRVMEALTRGGVPAGLRTEVAAMVERSHRLEQQGALLQPFQRMFRYWHAFHLPLAIVMLLILVVHVGVAVAFGYTWIF
ncbi:MAG: hypothetical protein R3E10_07230 [Gemmatimonadota bacterium]